MPELCERCRHRQLADKSVLERLSTPIASASARAAMVQQLGQLDGALTTEGLVFDRSVVSALTRRPVFHDWCAARSQTEEMTFYFCDWLDTPTCAFFQCADVEAGCERCDEW